MEQESVQLVWKGENWNVPLPKFNNEVPTLHHPEQRLLPLPIKLQKPNQKMMPPSRKKLDGDRQQKTRLAVELPKKNIGDGTRRRLVEELPKMSTGGVQKRNIVAEWQKKNIDVEWRNNKLDRPKSNVVDMLSNRLLGNTSNIKRSNVDEWQNNKPQNNVGGTKKPCESSSSGVDNNLRITSSSKGGPSSLPSILTINTTNTHHSRHMLNTINNNGNNNNGISNNNNTINNSKHDHKLHRHNNSMPRLHSNPNMLRWQIKLKMTDRQLLPS
jgi:hypothetical protein